MKFLGKILFWVILFAVGYLVCYFNVIPGLQGFLNGIFKK